jgi:macrolide transport system ATP-binding/permease protein
MWGRRKRTDFGAEIEAHLQLEADQFRAEGLTAGEAEAKARRAFGNRTRAEERFYESGRWLFWDHLVRDLRFAVRMLGKDPRFSTLAVLGLALGIAVTTAVFTLINASVEANEVRQDANSYVGLTRVINGRAYGNFSYSEYCYYRDRATTLRTVTAESGRERFLMGQTNGGEAEEVQGRFDTGNFLSATGLQPALGRSFSAAEEQGAGTPVALLAYRFWKRRFASDPGVLGKTVTLNAHALTIVGVADGRHGAGDTSDFYLPLGLQPVLLSRGDWLHDPEERWLMLDALMRPGISARQAQAEVDVLASALLQSAPAHPGDGGVVVTPGGFNPDKRKEMLALVVAVTIAVSMILLIACSNLANLLLARAAVRQREIGVRLSLGASRGRLVAQLLTESMLLALAGGALGLLFSHWLAKGLLVMMNAPAGMALDLRMEPMVVLYALVLSVATGLSFGLAPALTATRTNLAHALHAEGLSGAAGRQSRRIWTGRNALVIVPLAVSLMLLLGAGVTLRQVQRRAFNGPSFDASRLVGASFRLNMQGYDQARTVQFQENLRQRIARMPGVTSVALATAMPLSNGMGWYPLAVEGRQSAAGPSSPHADYNVISPGYFETVGAPAVRGRAFTADDREGSPPVAMVNQELARHNWPHEEAIGKRIRLSAATGPYFEVVGVAPDMQDTSSPYNSVRPMVYVPYAQGGLFLKGMRMDPPPYQMQFLARTTGEAAALKAAIRQEAHATDSALRVNIETVEESLEARFGPVKTISMMLSALSGLALLMASVGIYAILAYAVSQRTREIGIRTALGAQRREILALVMQRTVAMIAWGIGLGLVGALAARGNSQIVAPKHVTLEMF